MGIAHRVSIIVMSGSCGFSIDGFGNRSCVSYWSCIFSYCGSGVRDWSWSSGVFICRCGVTDRSWGSIADRGCV